MELVALFLRRFVRLQLPRPTPFCCSCWADGKKWRIFRLHPLLSVHPAIHLFIHGRHPSVAFLGLSSCHPLWPVFVAFIPFVSFASAHPRSPSSLGGSFFLLSISARLPLLNGVQRWASGGWEEIGKARNQLPCCRRRRSLVVRRRSLRLITHVQVSKSNSAGE